MHIDNFERRARQAFETYRPESDCDAIWDQIEPRLKKKKKRRGLILFFFGAGAALLGWYTFRPHQRLPANEQAAFALHLPETAPISISVARGFKPLATEMEIERIERFDPLPLRADTLTPPVRHLSLSGWYDILEAAPASTDEKEKDKETPDEKDKRDKKKKPRFKHEFALRAGLMAPFKILTRNRSAAEPASYTYLEERKDSERMLEAFSAGASYQLALRNGLTFRAGLDYRRFNEKFRFAYLKKETQQVPGIVAVTVDASGQTIEEIKGLKTVTTIVEHAHTAYSSYDFVHLPFGAGLRQSGKNQYWEMSAGLDYNLAFRFKGTLFAREGDVFSISGNNSVYHSIFKRNSGWGAWAACSYAQRLRKGLYWSLGAQVNAPLGALTQASYGLKQRYFALGLQSGLVFDLPH